MCFVFIICVPIWSNGIWLPIAIHMLHTKFYTANRCKALLGFRSLNFVFSTQQNRIHLTAFYFHIFVRALHLYGIYIHNYKQWPVARRCYAICMCANVWYTKYDVDPLTILFANFRGNIRVFVTEVIQIKWMLIAHWSLVVPDFEFDFDSHVY